MSIFSSNSHPLGRASGLPIEIRSVSLYRAILIGGISDLGKSIFSMVLKPNWVGLQFQLTALPAIPIGLGGKVMKRCRAM